MVLIDADVIIIDRRFSQDPKYADNSKFFAEIAQRGIQIGMSIQALLETVGLLSYGTSTAMIPTLAHALEHHYRLQIVPSRATNPDYASCTIDEIIVQMTTKMSLGDAVQAVQIIKYAPANSTLITWNAKHFLGKLPIPVQTPAEWLASQAP